MRCVQQVQCRNGDCVRPDCPVCFNDTLATFVNNGTRSRRVLDDDKGRRVQLRMHADDSDVQNERPRVRRDQRPTNLLVRRFRFTVFVRSLFAC